MPGLEGQILVFGTDPKTGSRVAETRINVTFGEPVQAMIQITEPVQGAVLDITQPVRVAGEAEGLYEGNVTVQALDASGAVLAQGSTTVQSEDAGVGGKGPWSLELDLSQVAPGTKGRIVAFNMNPATGQRQGETGIDVTFGQEMVEAPSTLEGPLWLLTQINGRQPLEGVNVYVTFENGKVSGSAGCNTFNGSYTSDASTVQIGPLSTTRKACAEPAGIMDQENEFLKLMQAAATYSTANGMLTLNDANGAPILTLSPAVVGELTYLARIALPPDATVIVTLEDVSMADAPAQIIGQTTMKAPAAPPIPFAVTYNLQDIDETHTYNVRAEIQAADGSLLFTTDTAHHVITNGNPSYVEITLVQP
jgi:putative lipoprotein